MTKIKITGAVVLFAFFIISSLALLVIDLARAVYWISAVGIGVALFGFVILLVSYLSDGFITGDDGLFSVGCLVLAVLFYIFANVSYEVGYSESAIKTKMAATQYIDWYNEVTGLNQKITVQLIDALCKSPSHNCNRARAGYVAYEQAYGLKDDADSFASLLRIAKIK